MVDARARLAMGGVTTVAASAAVICLVAFTNSAVLADSEGSTVAAPRVVVPSTGSAAPAAEALPEGTTTMVVPETVQAPHPVVVAEPRVNEPQTPVPAVPSDDASGPGFSAEPDEAVAAAAASGRWDEVRAWALAHGWSPGRTDAWISRLQDDAAVPSLADDESGVGGKPGAAELVQLGDSERVAVEPPKRGNGKQPANMNRSQLRPGPSPVPSPSSTPDPAPGPGRPEAPIPAPPADDVTVDPGEPSPPASEPATRPSQRPEHAGPPAQTPPQVRCSERLERARNGSDKNQSRDSPKRRG
ncbi:hypothetical protein [Microbacterium yannicii]|uniref:hypothetical protein n=1 Tax=Microbacterium yannicii TaxID=671622 RepID=UPI0002EA14C5|nr:hypothetical protein [Microbacterium yannicii]